MRLSCFMPPCRQRSGAPGRSRRSASYTNFTCLHVDRNTTTLACARPAGSGRYGRHDTAKQDSLQHDTHMVCRKKGTHWQCRRLCTSQSL